MVSFGPGGICVCHKNCHYLFLQFPEAEGPGERSGSHTPVQVPLYVSLVVIWGPKREVCLFVGAAIQDGLNNRSSYPHNAGGC